MSKLWPALFVALALSACGGGSSSEGTPAAPATPSAPASPAATFLPARLAASVTAGTSKALTVSATIVRPADFDGVATVYAFIVDDVGVIMPTTQITKVSATEYSATLFTAATLAAGSYQGNFALKLCKDAACAAQFPGSPVALPYEFTVTPPALPQITVSSSLPLSESIRLGAPSTLKAVLAIKSDGRSWTASSDAAWLKLSASSGSGSGNLNVSYDATGLKVGQYSTTVSIKSADGQSATVPASLNVMETAFQIQGSNLVFNAVNGAPIPSQALKFTLDNAVPTQWSAVSDAAWLAADPLAGLTPATSTLSVTTGSTMASGRYNGTLTLSSPLSKPLALGVTLNLAAPTLSLSAGSLTLGGTYGRESSNASLTMQLNTQGNRWPWALSAAPAWVQPGALSGSVDQNGATIGFTPNAAAAPLGTTTAVLNVGARINGDAVSVPLTVTINKDQRKLLAAETGVALSSTPSWSRLSRTIKISDNFGLDAGWSASADQTWLSVTASGRTAGGAGTLTLNADPATLPDNQVSYATVTLASTASGVVAPETIRVALWKGTVTPAAQVKLAQAYTNIVADPIRPLVYVHAGASSLDVYNVYTGAKTATVASLGAALGTMAISPNGDTLYVFDTANRAIVPLDLASLVKKTAWPLTSSVGNEARLVAMHPNGVNIVMTNTNGAWLASSGASLGARISTGEIAASGDSRRLFTGGIDAYSVDYSEINGGSLMVAKYASSYLYGQGAAGSVAANLDGSRVYTANGAPYRCTAYSGKDATEIGALPGGDAYPNNVKVASDGRVFCGISGWYSTADVWVHQPDGSLQSSFKFAGYARALLARQLAVSGDALMMVALTDDPALVFVPVGP